MMIAANNRAWFGIRRCFGWNIGKSDLRSNAAYTVQVRANRGLKKNKAGTILRALRVVQFLGTDISKRSPLFCSFL